LVRPKEVADDEKAILMVAVKLILGELHQEILLRTIYSAGREFGKDRGAAMTVLHWSRPLAAD
jgi:hypothetical protein